MVLTEAQKKFRKTGVSASEVATILGLNKYQRPIDLWQRKLNLIPEQETNPAMERGILLEPYILAWAIKRVGPIKAVHTKKSETHPLAIATPDGMLADGCLVEAKSVNKHAYKNDWSKGVPVYYYTQIIWQLGVFGAKKCYVPVAIVNDSVEVLEYAGSEIVTGIDKFEMFEVEFDQAVFDKLYAECKHFYTEYIVKEVAPPNDLSAEYVLYLEAQVQERRNEMIEAGPKLQELIEKLRETSGGLDLLKKELARVQNAVKSELVAVDGVAGDWGKITYKNQTRSSVDMEKLIADYNITDLDKYKKVSTFKVFKSKFN